MDSQRNVRSRRTFDSRYDYNFRRGTTVEEAERVIILRLVNGVSPVFLAHAARGWRGGLTDSEKNDNKVRQWYDAIDMMVNDEKTMHELKVRADFYLGAWNINPKDYRLSHSLNDLITRELERVNALKRNDDKGPVAFLLDLSYAAFECRHNAEAKFRKAAEWTYFEATQPDAAEFLRKRAADEAAKLAEFLRKRAADEAAKLAELAAAAAAMEEAGSGETAFGRVEDPWPLRRNGADTMGKGKCPLVWDWEKAVEPPELINVDGLPAPVADMGEQVAPAAVSSRRKSLRTVMAEAAEKRRKEHCVSIDSMLK